MVMKMLLLLSRLLVLMLVWRLLLIAARECLMLESLVGFTSQVQLSVELPDPTLKRAKVAKLGSSPVEAPRFKLQRQMFQLRRQ